MRALSLPIYVGSNLLLPSNPRLLRAEAGAKALSSSMALSNNHEVHQIQTRTQRLRADITVGSPSRRVHVPFPVAIDVNLTSTHPSPIITRKTHRASWEKTRTVGREDARGVCWSPIPCRATGEPDPRCIEQHAGGSRSAPCERENRQCNADGWLDFWSWH